jgi:hypothetical protein
MATTDDSAVLLDSNKQLKTSGDPQIDDSPSPGSRYEAELIEESLGNIKIKSEVPSDWPCLWISVDQDTDNLNIETLQQKTKRILNLSLIVVIFVSTLSFDTVLFVRISKTFQAPSLFISQGIYPIIFVPIIWILIGIRELLTTCYQRRKKKPNYQIAPKIETHISDSDTENEPPEGNLLEFNASITPSCKKFDMDYIRIFATVALCDTISALFTIIPAIYMDPILFRITDNIEIPINMIMGKIYSGKKYKSPHYVGASVILISIFTFFVSLITKNNIHELISITDIIWVLMILISKIPGTFSKNYTEWHVKQKNMDVWFFTGGVALFQLFFSLPLIFTVLIPSPNMGNANEGEIFNITSTMSINYNRPVTTANMLSFMKFTGNCLLGDFTKNYPETIFYNDTNISSSVFIDNGIECNSMGNIFVAYMIINVFFNVIQTDLIKLTTSNISLLMTVLTLISTNMLFSIKPLAAVAFRQPQIQDFCALIGVVIGLISFWSVAEILPKKALRKRTTQPYESLDLVKPAPKCCDCLGDSPKWTDADIALKKIVTAKDDAKTQ